MGRWALLILLGFLLLAMLSDQLVAAERTKRKKKRKVSADVKAASSSPAAMHHYQRGVMAHVQGDIQGAKHELRAAIDAKPDFAYAYYRLGFVLHEEREVRRAERKREGDRGKPATRVVDAPVQAAGTAGGVQAMLAKGDDPVELFRVAIGIDGRDESVYHALGQALRDDGRLAEANDAYLSVAVRVNPKSAQAYWGLGKLAALSRDEFESDPDDPDDPSHYYALAARLQPVEYQLDGTRIRRVEPNTPEREARREAEAKERRERFLSDVQAGNRQMRYAGE